MSLTTNDRSSRPNQPLPYGRGSVSTVAARCGVPASATAWHHRFATLRLPIAVMAVATALYLLPGRERIAPEIAGDNAYLFQAADRLYAGLGVTSVPPVAPLQPWEWTADWSWLTQWPVGYPILLCAVRWLLGSSSVAAGQAIAVACCALALVGWYEWLRRALPAGIAALLISAVGAACSVSVAALVTPATDTVVVALLPWVLLAAAETSKRRNIETSKPGGVAPARCIAFAAVGLFASSLCWVRYAAIFIPAGIGLYLVVECFRRRTRVRQVLSFALGAALPLAALVMLNRAMSPGGSVQQQLNLGAHVGFDFAPELPATAWRLWTDLPFYGHKAYSKWFFALGVPLGVAALTLPRRRGRAALFEFVHRPPVVLSAAVALALFALLISCTTLFKSKYDYIGLERYYRPIKPLYFVLLVGPILAIRWRPVRAATAAAMVVALLWMVRIEWPRPYQRWSAANRVLTDYGRWENAFAPHSRAVFDWLRWQADPTLVVFSNFQDEIALETGIPAVPLPEDRETMGRWLASIRRVRGVDEMRVWFMIDPDYHNREYYLPPLPPVVEEMGLVRDADAPAEIARFVWSLQAGGLTR